MNLLRKLYELLSHKQRRQAAALLMMMVVGMGLEMLGVGLVLPALSILMDASPERFLPQTWRIYFQDRQNALALGVVALLMMYGVKAAFLSLLAVVQMRFAFRIQEDVSLRLFTYYLGRPYSFHTAQNSSRLLQNVINEVSVLVAALTSLMTLASELLVLCGLAVILMLVEPLGVLVVGCALAGAGFIFHRATRNLIQRLGLARQHHEGLRVQHVQQGLGGIKDIKIFGREKYFLDAFRVHNRESSMVSATQASLQILPRPWLELIAVLALVLLSLFIMQRGEQAGLVPALGVFAVAAFRLLPSVNRVLAAIQSAKFALPVVDTLHAELVFAKDAPLPISHQSPNRLFNDSLMIENVSFRYQDAQAPALNNINLSIKCGEMIGIIGTSGSGKTTLVDLMLGLLTPDSGRVLVDGFDIESNVRLWQDQVGYVPQTVYLSDDTLYNNIAFGVNASQADEKSVLRAVRDAQLGSFIDGLPEGLQTRVGERGVRLSGGQRQRIGIARALYGDPPVLLLDEATSALDLRTEEDVMATVMQLHGKKTIIVISHRMESILRCDRVFRIEDGVAIEVAPETLKNVIAK